MMNNNEDSVSATRDQGNNKDTKKKSYGEEFDFSVSCYVMDKKNRCWSKLFTTGLMLGNFAQRFI